MTSDDKRKHERIRSLHLSYVCLDENDNIVKQGMGRTLNISEAGILLETHFPIESRYIVQLTIGLEEDLIDIRGKPIHIRSNDAGKYEIGIHFLELNQEATRILKRFISVGGIQEESSVEEDD